MILNLNGFTFSIISDGFQCGNFTKKNQGQYCKKFLLNYSDCYGTSKIKKLKKKKVCRISFSQSNSSIFQVKIVETFPNYAVLMPPVQILVKKSLKIGKDGIESFEYLSTLHIFIYFGLFYQLGLALAMKASSETELRVSKNPMAF